MRSSWLFRGRLSILLRQAGFFLAITWTLLAGAFSWAQQRRKVIINENCSGPGGSNMQTLMLLIQPPRVDILGITVVSGDH